MSFSTDFVVLCTPDRCLGGNSYSADPGTGDVSHYFNFIYSDDRNDRGVQISLARSSDPVLDLFEPVELAADSLSLQSPFADLVGAIESGSIYDVPFAILLQSPMRGFPQSTVDGAITGKTHLVSSECGTLSLEMSKGRLSQLQLVQGAANPMSLATAETPLLQVRSRMFPNGLKEVRMKTEFETPVAILESDKWVANCSNEYIGQSGKRVLQNFVVTVNSVIRVPEQVNEAMDQFLASIADGTEIASDDHIAYGWRDGEVVLLSDFASIGAAKRVEQVHFGRTRVLVFCLLNVVVAGLLGWHLLRRQKQRPR